MKYPIKYLLFPLILCLITACDKEKLPGESTEGEVVFSVDYTVDGTSKAIDAGKDDYYMFTDFVEEEDMVYTFSGTLKKENCTTDCGEQLRIEIRDHHRNIDNRPFKLEQSLQAREYQFSDIKFEQMPLLISYNLYHVNVTSQSSGVGELKYSWFYQDDISKDQIIKDLKNPVINIVFNTDNIGEEMIALEVIDEQGNKCYREHRDIILGGYTPCMADFSAEKLSNGKIKLEAIVNQGMEPFKYTWGNGDTTRVIEVDPVNAEYELSILSGTDGCFNRIRKSIKIEGDQINMIDCSFTWDDDNNSWEKYRELSGLRFQFGKVTLIYTDDQGIEYRSDQNTQESLSFFEVTEVAPFQENENGDQTLKLTVKYQCDLWSSDGQKKSIEGEGTIAMAYPE